MRKEIHEPIKIPLRQFHFFFYSFHLSHPTSRAFPSHRSFDFYVNYFCWFSNMV